MSAQRAAIGRADLLRLLATEGEGLCERVAAGLGFSLAVSADRAQPSRTGRGDDPKPLPPPPTPPPPPKPPETKPQRYYRLLQRTRDPAGPDQANRRPAPPAGYIQADPLREDRNDPRLRPPPAPPLAPWRRLWPFLRTVLGSEGFGHDLDLPRLVDWVATARTFRHLPRLPRAGWAPAAQVIVDLGGRAAPFWADYHRLCRGLLDLRGGAGLALWYLTDGPEGLGQLRHHHGLGPREPYRLPDPGAPVLVLGDLGCVDGLTAPWRRLGERLRRQGCRPVALMPCPPRLWDPETVRHYRPVAWDCTTHFPRRLDIPAPVSRSGGEAPSGLHRLIRLLAHAIRVEPGLLRAVRMALPAGAADVGDEALVWRHPDVDVGPLAWSLRPERIGHWRNAALAHEAPATRAQVAALVRRFHAWRSPAVRWEEELIRAQAEGETPDPAAVAFAWAVARSLLDAGQDAAALAFRPHVHSWLLEWRKRQGEGFFTWSDAAAEALSAALHRVLRDETRQAGPLPLPQGLDRHRIRWALPEGAPREYLLRQVGHELWVKTPAELAGRGGGFVLGNTVARLELEVADLHWRYGDDRGTWSDTTHLMALDRDIRIEAPREGRVCIQGQGETLVIDGMTKPAWAKGIGWEGDDLVVVRHDGRRRLWVAPGRAPLFDRGGGSLGDYLTECGSFFDQSEVHRGPSDERLGLRQPEWASGFGVDEFGLYADWVLNRQGLTQRFRWIAPGRFWMGSQDGEPERIAERETRHEVSLTQGYWLADTACTQALWKAVMGENPSEFKGPDRPVETVSWNDIQQFIERLDHLVPGLEARLPSEAEWEHACRAGSETPFSFGANITQEQVNYNGNYPYAGGKKGLYRKETVDVKAMPANPWGLYQMHGNVREWCQDWYAKYPTEPVIDPKGPSQGVVRVLRGGSWAFNAGNCRSAFRYWDLAVGRFHFTGFRLALGRTGPAGKAGG